MCLYYSYYYVVALICSRYYSARKFSTNRLRSLENENKNQKNKKLNIFFLEFEISFLRNEFELSFRVVLRRNYIRKRQIISVRTVATLFNIEFRTEDNVKNTLNKTVRSEKISKKTNFRKN